MTNTVPATDIKSDLIKLAANGVVESQADVESGPVASTHADALTASNLKQIPDADELAPGIRLHNELNVQTDMATHTPPVEPTPGVPPELDPRTSAFRPPVHRSGSVFSVAVQPGSPTGTQPESEMRVHEDSPNSSGVISGASVTRTNTLANSITASDAGSLASDMSDSIYSNDVHEQEVMIDQQRMAERALMGGEAGIGGPVHRAFAPAREDILLSGISRPARTVSVAATVATSPSASVAPSVGNSPRGSVDESM